jgi:hypothetical protein
MLSALFRSQSTNCADNKIALFAYSYCQEMAVRITRVSTLKGEWRKVELCIDIRFIAPFFRRELLCTLSFIVLRSCIVVSVLN